jgi:hypothetical protein
VRLYADTRIPDVPYQVAEWRRTHPGEPIADGQIFTQPRLMGTKADPRSRTIFYQYRADRARRTLKGIDQQIAKAEKAVAGQAAVKRNRFVQLTGATKSINRELEAKARALAGLKGYVTNLEAPTAEFVLGATTSCGRSRRASACPRPTCAPGRSTTTNATRSRPT